MIKILHSGDWHLLLHKKKVPYAWQIARFKEMFTKLHALEEAHDIHIIAGDIFDKYPEPDEVCLFLEFVNNVKIPTYIIPGNHESTKKGQSFLEYFVSHGAIANPNVKIFTKNTRIEFREYGFQFYPYGEMQLDNLPPYTPGDILVSHIRGEVLPHITYEYDFNKLLPWKLILLADLHFNHRHKETNAYYPGSPVNVSFDRDEDKQYGVYSIDFYDDSNYNLKFIDLDLPKLIRRTVKAKETLKSGERHHIIYEVTGSVDELAQIENHQLLDKKVVHRPTQASKIDLKDMTHREELEAYLKYQKIEDVNGILEEFDSLGIK